MALRQWQLFWDQFHFPPGTAARQTHHGDQNRFVLLHRASWQNFWRQVRQVRARQVALFVRLDLKESRRRRCLDTLVMHYVICRHIIYHVISLMSDKYLSILCSMLPFCLETRRNGHGEWKISSGTGSILATVRSLWQRMPRRGSVYHCMLLPVILQSGSAKQWRNSGNHEFEDLRWASSSMPRLTPCSTSESSLCLVCVFRCLGECKAMLSLENCNVQLPFGLSWTHL